MCKSLNGSLISSCRWKSMENSQTIRARATLKIQAEITSITQSSIKISSKSTWSFRTWWTSCLISSLAIRHLRLRWLALSTSIHHPSPSQVTTYSTEARAAISRLVLAATNSPTSMHAQISLARPSPGLSFSGQMFWAHPTRCVWQTQPQLHKYLLVRQHLWSS